MLAGFVIGLVGGLVVPAARREAWVAALADHVTEPIAQIFLRLLFMLVIPLAVRSAGRRVAEMGDIRAFGRVGWRTLACTAAISFIAVGLALATIFRPGDGVDPAAAAARLRGTIEGPFEVAMQPIGLIRRRWRSPA